MKQVIQNSYTAGNAVYKARNLFAMYMPGLFYDDVDICNSVGVYKISNTDSTDYQIEQAILAADGNNNLQNEPEPIIFTGNEYIKVYPNPATDQITIEYVMETNHTGNFVINDMLGKTVQTIYLDGKNKRVTTILDKISAGVYSYKYIDNGMIRYSGKLLIK